MNVQGVDNARPTQNQDIKAPVTTSQGQYQGVAVSLSSTSTSSLVQDALEELTTGLSEKAEKDLSKRKVKDSLSSNQEMVNKIQQMMEAAFKVKKRNQVDQLVNDLLSGKQGGGAALRERLRHFSDDPSEQYLALLEIRRQLSKSAGNEAMLQVINQQLAQLESSDRNRIAAGLNSLLSAKEASDSGLGDIADLRGFYQDAVLDYKGLSGVWDMLVEKYGESRLDLATGFMLKALAADYESAGSSIEKNQLVSIMADMNHIKQLSSVYESCQQTAKIIDPDDQTLAREVMKHLLVLNDVAWAQTDDIHAFLAALNITDLETQIQVLTSVKATIGLIQPETYQDPEQPHQCISAINEVLDHLIGIEEYGQ